jgi:hypothetical protein
MPPLAALPAIIGTIGAGASAAGSIYNAAKGGNKATTSAVFPQMQGQYLQQLGGGLGPTSMNTMQQMAQTGMPTDVGPMFESLLKSRQRFDEQGRSNILEQFGASGLRYSTPLMNSLVDYESQLNANYGNILANYIFNAQESARGRQMAAANTGLQAYAAPSMTLQGQYSTPGAGMQSAGANLMAMVPFLQQTGMFGK